jgi:uncharacterized membrane protein YgcG
MIRSMKMCKDHHGAVFEIRKDKLDWVKETWADSERIQLDFPSVLPELDEVKSEAPPASFQRRGGFGGRSYGGSGGGRSYGGGGGGRGRGGYGRR